MRKTSTRPGASITLNWRGPQIERRMMDAARQGIDDVLERAADTAQARTPRVSGRLERSMRNVPAKPDALRTSVEGSFGSFGVPYAREVEDKRRMIGMAAERTLQRVAIGNSETVYEPCSIDGSRSTQ